PELVEHAAAAAREALAADHLDPEQVVLVCGKPTPEYAGQLAAELGSAAAILATARGGTAPAVVSRLIVAHELRAGTLYEVPLADSVPLTRKFRAIWHRRSPPSGPAADLVELATRIEAARPSRRDARGGPRAG
uniref:LysR substrate-binding domain-containing protein n=1 Tax=Nocardia neocaledoniensis TaxID=236511 RepID=UPI0024537C3B